MNIFKAIIKYVETWIKDIYVSFNPNVVRLKTLAEKYNIDSNFHQIEIGSPDVVDPLNQIETIKHEWANEKLTNISKTIDKTDKGYRYFEASGALEAIDHLVNYRIDEGKKIFTELGIWGRVMFVYIASKQDDVTNNSLIKTIFPVADQGLYMSDNDFIKAEGVKVRDVFNKFIKPILDEVHNNGEGSSSDLNLDNSEFEEESNDGTDEYQKLIKNTAESAKLPRDITSETNNPNGDLENNETFSMGEGSLTEDF